MASQSQSSQAKETGTGDQQVPDSEEQVAQCRMLAVNGTANSQSDEFEEEQQAAAVVPVMVNGLEHAQSVESDEGTDCAGYSGAEDHTQSGACSRECALPLVNGYVSGHVQVAAALSPQPDSTVCSGAGLGTSGNGTDLGMAAGVLRSNGNSHYSSDEDMGLGDCAEQQVPEADDGQSKGARKKKIKKHDQSDGQSIRITCMNGQSPSDEEGNLGAFAKDDSLTFAACSGFAHRAGSGHYTDSFSSVYSPRSHDRHNNQPPGWNSVPQPEHVVQRQEDESDFLDMVDEGAVCDFDRNVFMEANSYCYPEGSSLPLSVAPKNIGADYLNGHSFSQDDRGLRHHRRHARPELAPHFRYCFDSDDDGLNQVCPQEAEGAVRPGLPLGADGQDAGEDNGDFIDADLPTMPGQLLSSSTDSASLSSSNGDLAEQNLVSFPADLGVPRQENNLSGGSGKELNHHPESPDSHAVTERGASFRTSYSSPSHDGGFDNFLTPHELSSSDGVFGNSSESENEDEFGETLPLDGHESLVPSFDGAGVAEATASPHIPDQSAEGHQFGAVCGLCFQFEVSCRIRGNECQGEHTASGMPPACWMAHSAALHERFPHDPPLEEGEAGGACAPPPPVNNLSRLHPATPATRAMESMANGLDDVAPSNFINDESNRQQKVFVKFPMMRNGRDGACGGSSAGQGKCDSDNVRCPCPGPQMSAHSSSSSSSGDTGVESDQPNLQGSLGPNVESFRVASPPDHKHSHRENGWLVHESGVAEPIYEEICDFPECRDTDCGISYNALHPVPVKKLGRDGKKKRVICRPVENGVDASSVERVMIWNEYEAYLLQVKQIGLSACGQTAVLNLLKAFELPAEKKDVCCQIHVNLRKEKASVAEYLASRAVAGTTAEELLAGVERLTKGEIRGRFFHFWPPRDVHLLSWISDWMKRGAVPIATLNLQLGVKQQQVPDAWHHQMVYGVGPRGVYLTNPLEIVPEDMMMQQLSSDSVLLVRRQDVVSRFQPTASLAPLMHHRDPRWCTMNVLGQVVNVLREHNMPSVPGYRAQVTSHVRIPAVYRAGIALYVRHNTDEWKALRDAPDLPLKRDNYENADT